MWVSGHRADNVPDVHVHRQAVRCIRNIDFRRVYDGGRGRICLSLFPPFSFLFLFSVPFLQTMYCPAWHLPVQYSAKKTASPNDDAVNGGAVTVYLSEMSL